MKVSNCATRPRRPASCPCDASEATAARSALSRARPSTARKTAGTRLSASTSSGCCPAGSSVYRCRWPRTGDVRGSSPCSVPRLLGRCCRPQRGPGRRPWHGSWRRTRAPGRRRQRTRGRCRKWPLGCGGPSSRSRGRAGRGRSLPGRGVGCPVVHVTVSSQLRDRRR